MNLPNPLFDSQERPERKAHNEHEVRPALFLVPVKEPRGVGFRGILWLLLVAIATVAALAHFGYIDLQAYAARWAQVPAVQKFASRVPLTGQEIKEGFVAWRKGRAGVRNATPPAGTAENSAASATKAAEEKPENGAADWKDDLAKRSAEWQQRMKSLESAQAAESKQAPPEAVPQQAAPGPAQGVAGPIASREQGKAETTEPGSSAPSPLPVKERSLAAKRLDAPPMGAKRIDFQVRKGHATQIAPGISLEMKRGLVRSQQFDADLRLPSRRTLKIVAHRANDPLRFFQLAYERTPVELVVTDIGEDFALGYVLLPRRAL